MCQYMKHYIDRVKRKELMIISIAGEKAFASPLNLVSCILTLSDWDYRECMSGSPGLCLKTSWAGSHPGAKNLQSFLRLGKRRRSKILSVCR